ncbi:MAG: sigma-70 family RNA polymerase sigma factor [Planctomycetota bacterium]
MGLTKEQIDAVVNEHQDALFHFALFLSRDYTLAEDIAQETFLIACRKLVQEKPEGDVGKWLRGIARNVHLRQKARKAVFALDENILEMAENFWVAKTESGHAESPYTTALVDCIKLLSDSDRKMIELRYSQNPGREELSKALDISVSALETRLKRAKKQLKECVESKTGRPI